MEGITGLLNQNNYGLLLSSCALLKTSITMFGNENFVPLMPQLVTILSDIQKYSQDYYYYMTPCPWLQVKILQILQLFAPPAQNPDLISAVVSQIKRIYKYVEVTKHVNKNNSDHSILFEAINLAIMYEHHVPRQTRGETVRLLAKFIGVKEPNIRYLALECMAKLKPIHLEADRNLIKDNLETFFSGLKEKDISIRKRALDTIFYLCN